MPRFSGALDLAVESSDPTTPPSNRAKLYFKSDGLLYKKTSDGTVAQVAGGGAAPSNMVTTDTDQDIFGVKKFLNSGGRPQVQFGPTGTVLSVGTSTIFLYNATTTNDGGTWTAIQAGGATAIQLTENSFLVYTAPSVAAGATLTFTSRYQQGSGAGDFKGGGITTSGPVTTSRVSLTGLTGATAGGRWVGFTTSGAPTGGTFAVADWIIARDTGRIWICTVAGTPGTWLEQTPGAPSNMVTTDTNQTISGTKTFSAQLNMSKPAGGRVMQASNGLDSFFAVDISAQGANGGEVAMGSAAGTKLHLMVNAANKATLDDTGKFTATTLYEGANRVYSAGNKPTPFSLGAAGLADTQDFTGQNHFSRPKASGPAILLPAAAATSGTTNVPSPTLRFSSGYWNSGAFLDNAELYAQHDSNAAGQITLRSSVRFQAPALKVTGLTGAQNTSRYVGATASAAPTSGTFEVGDWVIALTGKIFICTVAGTPGTWVEPGGGGGAEIPIQTEPDPAWSEGTIWFDPDDNSVSVTEIIEVYPFFQTGALTVKAGQARVYLEENYSFESIRASVGTAPVGASIFVDVNLNGTSIFGSGSGRPEIISGAFTSLAGLSGQTVTQGQYLTVDIDQIGSTTPGSDLNVVIRLRRR